MLKRSRLTKRLEAQSRKSFFLTVLIIIGILYVLFQFGVPLLGSAGIFLSSNDDSIKNSQKDIILPPILHSSYEATKSAQVNIEGNATSDLTIQLYINDDLVDKTKAKKDGTFEFKDIILEKGSNVIKTKAVDTNRTESEFSNAIIITYKNEPPSLSIDSPGENQSFKKEDNTAVVTGKTDPGVRVTVNGFWAITNDSGNYTYQLLLKDGENVIKVVAKDEAGNTKEMERKVTYSP